MTSQNKLSEFKLVPCNKPNNFENIFAILVPVDLSIYVFGRWCGGLTNSLHSLRVGWRNIICEMSSFL
jgi:hypothetical protein